MAVRLAHNAYGKHSVRISKIRRNESDPTLHSLVEATVGVILEGDLDGAYVGGDNQSVVATDTCKNTVYVLAKDHPLESIESFAVTVAEHFLRQYDHLHTATVTIHEKSWQRLLGCPHAFTGNDSCVPTTEVVARRNKPTSITSGMDQLVIAKTTESGFANFHRDEFRTLPDTDDRILATSVTANWHYSQSPEDFAASRETVLSAMLARFIDHYSHSVQETLMLMGEAAIESCAQISSIELTMPNKHHILFNLQPFGRENNNDVFMVTDEPFGYITARIDRDS